MGLGSQEGSQAAGLCFFILCTPFLLVAQSGCCGASRRIYIPTAERGREEYSSLELCSRESP